MVARRQSPFRLSALTWAVAAAVLAVVLSACGSQIPFRTPRPSAVVTPTPVSSGDSSVPPSGAPTAAPTTPPTPGSSNPPSVPPESGAPAPTPPATAVTFDVAGTNGLKITMPPGWIGFDSESPDAAVQAVAREHPELAGTLASLGSNQLLFVAFDASATGVGQAPSLTITSAGGAIPSKLLLEALARQAVEQIKATQPVEGEVALRTVDLLPGPAVNARYGLKAIGDGESLGLDAYFVSVGSGTYIVTFAAPISVLEGFAPAFEAIVNTMQEA